MTDIENPQVKDDGGFWHSTGHFVLSRTLVAKRKVHPTPVAIDPAHSNTQAVSWPCHLRTAPGATAFHLTVVQETGYAANIHKQSIRHDMCHDPHQQVALTTCVKRDAWQ